MGRPQRQLRLQCFSVSLASSGCLCLANLGSKDGKCMKTLCKEGRPPFDPAWDEGISRGVRAIEAQLFWLWPQESTCIDSSADHPDTCVQNGSRVFKLSLHLRPKMQKNLTRGLSELPGPQLCSRCSRWIRRHFAQAYQSLRPSGIQGELH